MKRCCLSCSNGWLDREGLFCDLSGYYMANPDESVCKEFVLRMGSGEMAYGRNAKVILEVVYG